MEGENMRIYVVIGPDDRSFQQTNNAEEERPVTDDRRAVQVQPRPYASFTRRVHQCRLDARHDCGAGSLPPGSARQRAVRGGRTESTARHALDEKRVFPNTMKFYLQRRALLFACCRRARSTPLISRFCRLVWTIRRV
jgi:hypothetical protein